MAHEAAVVGAAEAADERPCQRPRVAEDSVADLHRRIDEVEGRLERVGRRGETMIALQREMRLAMERILTRVGEENSGPTADLIPEGDVPVADQSSTRRGGSNPSTSRTGGQTEAQEEMSGDRDSDPDLAEIDRWPVVAYVAPVESLGSDEPGEIGGDETGGDADIGMGPADLEE